MQSKLLKNFLKNACNELNLSIKPMPEFTDQYALMQIDYITSHFCIVYNIITQQLTTIMVHYEQLYIPQEYAKN